MLGLGLSLTTVRKGGLVPPVGYVFLLDEDGAYLIEDGFYLIEAIS